MKMFFACINLHVQMPTLQDYTHRKKNIRKQVLVNNYIQAFHNTVVEYFRNIWQGTRLGQPSFAYQDH